MKKILAILTLAGLAFASTATAQSYAVQQLFKAYSAAPVGWPAAAATNFTAPGKLIDCRRQKDVSFQLTVQANDSTTDNVTLYFKNSLDASKASTAAYTIGVAMTGVTEKTILTNIAVSGAGYLYLSAISNAAATAVITNCVVSYAIKTDAP